MPPGVTADHRPAVLLDHVGVVVLALLLLGVLDQVDDAVGRRVVRGHPVERHVEQPGVEVLGEQLRVGVPEFPQLLPDLQHVLQQHVGGGVGLAGQEHPARPVLLHRPLEPGEDGEGGASTLLPVPGGPWTSRTGVRPWPPMNSRLPASKSCRCPACLEGVEPGQERRLARRAGSVARRRRRRPAGRRGRSAGPRTAPRPPGAHQ